jgi:hypothetical protein
VTGETFEVPQQIPEREGPRRGDVRPLLDGRVAMIVDDGNGASTVWVLARTVARGPRPSSATSSSRRSTRQERCSPDPSTLAYDLVALA